MKRSAKKILFKTVKITGIVIASIILLLFLLPYLFPGTISQKIKDLANNKLKGELNFSKARLSFFNHFPALTLTLYDFSLKGSAPFQQDTLVAAKELALGIDMSTLFKTRIDIDKIFLSDAFINIQVDQQGNANYNVYVSTPAASANKDTSGASLKIEKILIERTHLVYNDRSLPMLIDARNINYTGQGDLSKDIFDLQTHAEIGSMDFTYNKQSYFLSKRVNADLVTRINTNSLELLFQKNDLKINQLPVQFIGRFSFLKNGYDMDFQIQSKATELQNIFTALPAEYNAWLQKTEVSGTADIGAELSGQYIAATNTMPSFTMNMGIRSGFIGHEKTPSPVKNLFLNLEAKLPGCNPDSLYLNIDSIFFNIDKDYFSSVIRVKGIKQPEIYARINSEIDLEKWDKAFGVEPFDVKGRYSLHLLADGKYATAIVKKGLRGIDTVITSIPKFTVQSSFTGGYFKYASLPESVNDISFQLNASCPDNNYHHATIAFDNINARILSNYIKGFIRLQRGDDFPIDADLHSVFHLADIKKVYPLNSMEVKGNLDMNIQTKGRFNPSKKLFPVTNATFKLEDGSVQTKYYPAPIQKIVVDASVVNTDGTLATTKVFVKPVSFEFEGQPFQLKAGLQNFNDLKYDVVSKGTIDVSRIYKVFSQKGLDVKGFIRTSLVLKGLQSDATAGHYDKLFNAGKLEIKDISISSEYFPQPFLIKNGIFSFKQDKMWFDSFTAQYGKSDFTLNGYLSNLLNYTLQNQSLTGNFDLKSNLILVDEFMAFADKNTAAKNTPAKTASTGVIIVPSNLDLTFTASANTVQYNGLMLKDAKGTLQIKDSTLTLQKTGFTLIDAPVVMDASYKSLSPRKAWFDYHINAKDFDIQKAYNQVKLFHDMASAAGKAQGIVSLDYSLKGRLNDNMFPVYPSLEGGGTLSIKNVKVKGLKLFSAVSAATNRDSINNPDISKVDIKTTIKNNIITITPAVKMKVMGFRPKIEGQVSFDGKLNLKFRLGLPPLGIFGIPMNITGTQDNPKVKLGRGKGELEETKDTEEN